MERIDLDSTVSYHQIFNFAFCTEVIDTKIKVLSTVQTFSTKPVLQMR